MTTTVAKAEETGGWMAEEDRYVIPSYGRFPFVIAGGEGSRVWDDRGNRYLDFYGGHAVALLGHCPAPVVEAVSRQARRLIFYSNMVYSDLRARAAKSLVALCGVEGAQVFFSNSGAEANENALRIARLATGRGKVVGTYGSFHGRTVGALAATGMAKYKFGLPGPANTVHVPFGDLRAAQAAVGKDTAAFILEPVQSMAGVVTPPPRYLRGLETLCRDRGCVLIFDEIQTGLGRLGAPTAARAFHVKPGIMTFAKALGSGVPCGATLASPELTRRLRPGDLGSTFGGGPLACAAIEATLSVLLKGRLWRRAASLEKALRARLKSPPVRDIRGRGLLLGLVLDRPARDVRDHLFQRRILTGLSEDPRVLRLLPPMTITQADIETVARALEEAA